MIDQGNSGSVTKVPGSQSSELLSNGDEPSVVDLLLNTPLVSGQSCSVADQSMHIFLDDVQFLGGFYSGLDNPVILRMCILCETFELSLLLARLRVTLSSIRLVVLTFNVFLVGFILHHTFLIIDSKEGI